MAIKHTHPATNYTSLCEPREVPVPQPFVSQRFVSRSSRDPELSGKVTQHQRHPGLVPLPKQLPLKRRLLPCHDDPCPPLYVNLLRSCAVIQPDHKFAIKNLDFESVFERRLKGRLQVGEGEVGASA
ncbi:hypothetical protein PTT_17020 [Pyrenophora teres f. teres 0-1]|uniref:Uncharacterized protein n=1 Tax=Pyrenophora teres f. teres (strain 0-1) TaxID=861557 RepID=E3S3H5_PYRTT|nr:hypothetical protein PTT_17020 [Pyrenophora teres f. teres 0-1]